MAGPLLALFGLVPLLLWPLEPVFRLPALAFALAYAFLPPLRLGLFLLAPAFLLPARGPEATTAKGFLRALEGGAVLWGFAASYSLFGAHGPAGLGARSGPGRPR